MEADGEQSSASSTCPAQGDSVNAAPTDATLIVDMKQDVQARVPDLGYTVLIGRVARLEAEVAANEGRFANLETANEMLQTELAARRATDGELSALRSEVDAMWATLGVAAGTNAPRASDNNMMDNLLEPHQPTPCHPATQ